MILFQNHSRLILVLPNASIFSSLDMKIRLFKTFVRLQVEFSSCIWNPVSKQKIQILERVQKKATKYFMNNSIKSYTFWLSSYKLSSLHNRRMLLDCCKLYKIINHPSASMHLPCLGLYTCESITRPCDIKQNFIKNEWFRKKFTRRVVTY